MKIKIKNQRRLTYAVAILLGLLLTPSAIRTASLIRGYRAVGGEFLVPVLFILIAALISEARDLMEGKA